MSFSRRAVNASEDDNSDEEGALLNGYELESRQDAPKKIIDEDDFIAAPLGATGRQSSRVWLLRCLCFFFAATLVVAGGFVLWGNHSHRPQDRHQPPQLALALEPHKHVGREPRTLRFNWNITRGLRAPDGVEKIVYLVNDAFPGPTIEARSGDRIIVHVHNGLEDERASLHWHGLRMFGHNAMDGATGFTQCPIQPRANFVYDFKIGDEEHGTFWWHSHSEVQRADGLFGGLIVHDPADKKSPPSQDLLVMVGDWFHRSHREVLAWYADPSSLGREPVPDSLLINGRGRYNCSLAVPSRPLLCQQLPWGEFHPLLVPPALASVGKTRLRFVNTGTIAGFSAGIAGVTMTPIHVDGGAPVKGPSGDLIGVVYPGERIDVILEENWLVSAQSGLNIFLDDENFGSDNAALNPSQTFPLVPDNPKSQSDANMRVPTSQSEDSKVDMRQLTSSSSPAIPGKAHTTLLFYLKTEKLTRLDNEPVAFVNHTSWKPQNQPLLALNRSAWDANQLVPFIGSSMAKPRWVRIVLNNLDDGSHPFHLHGNSFYVLSSYRSQGRNSWGSYNPFANSEPPGGLNIKDPLLKDTVSVPRRGHVILTFLADNPGLWMLHCHMLVHMARGMAFGLHIGDIDDGDHIDGRTATAAQLCAVH